MARQQISLKQLAINKDNSTIVIAIAVATFITIFSLVASKSLLDQSSYQSKVIKQKKTAVKQLKTNADEVKKLNASYQTFASNQQNVLGGSSTGNGDKDGDNGRIVLDALPSKYDFPALATSLQKAFRDYRVLSISGTDEEIAQSGLAESAAPEPIEIPFNINIETTPQASKPMLEVFEKSIRPIVISNLELTGGEGGTVKFNIDAKTYFQPSKTFSVKKEKVKQ